MAATLAQRKRAARMFRAADVRLGTCDLELCQLPPALRGVVARRAVPFAGLVAFFPPPPSLSSFLPPPRSRSAAARRRPPTPLAFGLASSVAAPSALAFGSYSLPTSSTCATSALSPRRNPIRSRRG